MRQRPASSGREDLIEQPAGVALGFELRMMLARAAEAGLRFKKIRASVVTVRPIFFGRKHARTALSPVQSELSRDDQRSVIFNSS
jgi:hypothetical protein